MKHAPLVLALAAAGAFSSAAHADIAVDVIGGYEIGFEGLIQADGNWYDNDVTDLNGASGNDGSDSEFELRRSELVLKGKGTRFDWVVGYDAKANKWLDVNAKWKLGQDYMMFGQFKQPNSLEELSSTKNNDFISKSLTTNAFAISRRLGVAYGMTGGRWGATASLFGRELTRNTAHGSGYAVRGWFTPIQGGDDLLHIGLSAADFDTDADTLRLRARPDADLATARLIDTGSLHNTDRQRTLGVEGLWLHGPWKVQGEYMTASVDRYDHSNFAADSWYVQGVWNLTGEHFGYKAGVPTTPLPNEPASGMWQLGLRYDTADFDDAGVHGGQQDDLTIGVNYYWHSNFKVAANYVMVNSDRYVAAAGERVGDDPNIAEVRLQFFW